MQMTGPAAESMVPLHLFDPQAVGSATVAGETIERPWERGRMMAILVSTSDANANDDIVVNIEARRQGTSTWDDVLENDGSTSLAFTLIDETAGTDQSTIIGTLDLARLKSGTNLNSSYSYDAIRIAVTNDNATSPATVAVVGALYSLFTYPAKDLAGALVSDDLYFKQTPHTA